MDPTNACHGGGAKTSSHSIAKFESRTYSILYLISYINLYRMREPLGNL